MKKGNLLLRSRTLNMTVGNPLSLLAVFAIPLLIGNLFQQAYNLADSIIVGRLIGASALASVGATGSVTFLFFSVCNGMASGAGIVTSQYFGAGDEQKIKQSITNSAYIMFTSTVVMGLLAFSLAPILLRLMGTPEDILPTSITYMRMNCIGVPLIGVYNYSASMLRALGDSRTPLFFLICACILNVIMDVVFIAAFGLGVFGAALATIIAQLIAGSSCLIFAFKTNEYFKLEKRHFAFDGQITRNALRIGMPLALQWSLIAVSSTALQYFVNSFGTVAVAAFTATSRIEQLIHQPYGSLGNSLATYSGQNFGAKRLDRVRLGLRQSLLVVVAFSALMLLIMQLFSTNIIRIFIKEPEVIEMGAKALRLTSWFYFFLGLIYATRGVLNGIGDALFALINGVVEMLCRIFLPMLLVMIPLVQVWGIWWTAGLTWLISAIFCTMRYLLWKRKVSHQIVAGPEQV
ncbi:MAG: MATE family efflux transporter [Clostridia bacterium]|nr:MATE family efflux transporter [Clostridia bacterium]